MSNICRLCDREFKQLQNKKRLRCNSCNTKVRRFRNKQRAIELLGGKCNRCGIQGSQSIFDFHHLNPSEKDFTIGSVANKAWNSIVKEIEKCELLCSNCHRLEHSSKEEERFLKEVLKYNGKVAEMD